MMHPRLCMTMLIALGAASCQKEKQKESPVDPSREQLPKAASAKVAFASVSLQEDCPDADPPGASADESAGATEDMESVDRDDSGRGYYSPCSQSSMQLAISGQGDSSSTMRIAAVRLLGTKGETLGSLQPRTPMQWKASSYSSWDEVILPKTDIKASYKLSSPDWNEVQRKLGGNSYGALYRLEADIMIDDVKQTIRSSETVREQSQMVDT